MDHYFPVLFPFFFLGMWLLFSFLLSRMGGWHLLAQTFRTDLPFSGNAWGFQSAMMRWAADYRHCLTLGACPEGLYMTIWLVFRFGHPALLIPWNEIRVRKNEGIFDGSYILTLGREAAVPMRIRGKLGNRLRAAAGSSWPTEET